MATQEGSASPVDKMDQIALSDGMEREATSTTTTGTGYAPNESKGNGKGSAWSRWPKSTFCIVGNEFCERFNFYGMRAVLLFYLIHLGWGDDDATAIYHGFTVLAYFTPMLGALLADGFIGKFHTILWISLLYAAGSVLLAVAAVAKPGDDPHRWLDLLGLAMIGFGTGGIKPCVAPFGADQFRTGDEDLIERYFSFFYASINAGSLLSIVLSPIFSQERCLGQITCYPLSFGVPAVLMIAAVVVFMLGSFAYRRVPPKENIFAEVLKVIICAIKNKWNFTVKKDHWLDHYMNTHSCKWDHRCTETFCHKATLVQDIKNMLRVLIMLLPTPLFWTLYDQQGSRWLIQTAEMDYNVLGWAMPPALIQAINPILILSFIPLFQLVIYPLVRKCGIETTPLRRLVVGGLLAAVAFVVAGALQIFLINPTLPQKPAEGTSHMGFINTLDCDVTVHMLDGAGGEAEPFTLAPPNRTELEAPADAWSVWSDNVRSLSLGNASWSFSVTDASLCGLPAAINKTWTQRTGLAAAGKQYYTMLHAQFVGDGKALPVYEGTLEKDQQALGLFKINLNDLRTGKSKKAHEGASYYFCYKGQEESDMDQFCNPMDTYNFYAVANDSDISVYKDNQKISKFVTLLPDKKAWHLYKQNGTEAYDISIEAKDIEPIDLGVEFVIKGQGGIYILTIYDDEKSPKGVGHVLVKTVSDNTVPVLLQVPQIAIITAAEIMFSITGLEFAYTQCAPSMKSILQAAWLFCVSIGDMVIMVIAEKHIFDNLAHELFFFAALMAAVMVVLALMSVFYYTYNNYEQEEHEDGGPEGGGYDNKAADID